MIDLAKKFPNEIISNWEVLYRIGNSDYLKFNPESNEIFLNDLSLKILVSLNSGILKSNDSKSIFENCNQNISILINAQCKNTAYNHSTESFIIDENKSEYEFDFIILKDCISKDLTLCVSLFYSGFESLGEFNYWPNMSLLPVNHKFSKPWNFENKDIPFFNVSKIKGNGIKLVTLNLNNIEDSLNCDLEDIESFAVIDSACVGDQNTNDKYIISSVLYEYIEYLFFKPDLAETLIRESFEENSVGKNMKLFLESFLTSDKFSIEHIVALRLDLIGFKKFVYKYIENILK